MARQAAAGLPVRPELLWVEEAASGQSGVQRGAGVALAEHEVVAIGPLGLLGPQPQDTEEEDREDVRRREAAAEVGAERLRGHVDDALAHPGGALAKQVVFGIFGAHPAAPPDTGAGLWSAVWLRPSAGPAMRATASRCSQAFSNPSA
jgi:hypothetical protein